jgi:surfeit locus 1 family protein
MTWRRVPVVATLVVLIAVGIMIRLGFWQFDRLKQKEALIARYEVQRTAEIPLEGWSPRASETILYKSAAIECQAVVGWKAVSGRNASGASGWSHIADCLADFEGPTDGKLEHIDVVAGWSIQPSVDAKWTGGSVTGIIAPNRNDIKIVAKPPLGGLAANATPDPRDIPNNHFAYAIQWFLFAATALVIYGLALGKRLRG